MTVRGEWHPIVQPPKRGFLARFLGLDLTFHKDQGDRLLGVDGVVVAFVRPSGSNGFYGVIETPRFQVLPEYATREGARLSVEERLAHLAEPGEHGLWCPVCRGER